MVQLILMLLILLALIIDIYLAKDDIYLYHTIISYYMTSIEQSLTSFKILTLGISNYGHTSIVFGTLCNNTNSIIYGIDNFIVDDVYRYDIYQSIIYNINSYKLNNIQVVVGESISISNIWNYDIDILYIDTMNDYESYLSNFISWSNYVKDDGIILVRDIFNSSDTNFAWQLLNDYVEGYYHFYLNFNSNGVGVITRNYNVFHYLSTLYNFNIVGPTSLKSLAYLDEFSYYNMLHYDKNNWSDGRSACGVDQVPDIGKQYLKRIEHCYERIWSIELVDTLVEAATNKIDFSPGNYPYVVLDYYNAISKYPVIGKRVLVAGAISPWNEAIFIASGAEEVVTSEYSDLVSLDPRITVMHASELKHSQQFDVISSFSSIEHSGLGKYGDPIDPKGDFEAIKEFHSLLKTSGILFLGIPISGTLGYIQGNYHRIYSYERFYAMIQDKFNLLSVIDDHHKFYDQEKNDDWQNQPLLILEKI